MAVMVVEILSLLWSHPILTGLLILLFTTPLFHIVLFFTPLLMSTALCVIALISIGPQIEKIREERQFKMSIAARAVAAAAPPERPVNRYIVISQGRPQRPPMRLGGGGGGGRRWSDWVKGIEIHGHTIWLSESHIMRDIAEEGLKSDFSGGDGGGIAMAAEDFSKGAFSLEKGGGGDDGSGGGGGGDASGGLCKEADKDIEEEACMELVEAGKGIETGIVVAEGDELECGSAACGVVCIDEKVAADSSQQPQGRTNSGCFFGLVPVDSKSPGAEYLSETPACFQMPALALREKKRKKKRTSSWLRRRRIPCGISKALGQLKERICNQLRRIFS